MRTVLINVTGLCFLVLVGCGDNSGATGPLTDEQKKQIAIEDKNVAEEESQGSVNKKKAKK